MRRRKGNDTEDVLSILVLVLIAIIALPFYGIYLLAKEDPSKKTLGIILIILGIMLWLLFLLN
jgi:multisubunit Na+/H+ antiporter MnhG subunit